MGLRHNSRLHGVICLCILICFGSCNPDRTYTIETETIRITSPQQIVSLSGPVVKPILYTHISGLEKLPVSVAKKKFISAVLPSILIARYQVMQTRRKLQLLRDEGAWSKKDKLLYEKARAAYRAKDLDDLITRMNVLPVSIVLAQAAIESGWGKSRIFAKANNLFGVWSYNRHEPRIAALVRRSNRKVYLRAYPDVSHSIVHYYEIIGRGGAYKKLREALLHTQDPMQLAPYLSNFSERRARYTRQLKTVITKNNLTRYDHYVINPNYIREAIEE